MGNQSVISIEAVIDYIESHLDGKLELETVAEAVHYSKYHLHRLFTETVGMTIHDYVQRRQLTEAAKLLVFSDKPIIEIAFICGYESQQSFSLAFKAMYKSPPAEYREERSFYPLQLRFILHRRTTAMEFTIQDIRLAEKKDIVDWMNLMRLVWQPNTTIGYLDQYAEIDHTLTMKEFLKSAFTKLFEMEAQALQLYEKAADGDMKSLELAARYQEQLEAHDFYSIDTAIDRVANGLGLLAIGLDRPIAEMSGGQRAKVILAKLLLEKPDVLLLDEPTNFLDKDHVAWLAEYLSSLENAFLVVSHDFDFLDKIANRICDIDNDTITKYYGTYSEFLRKKTLLREDYIRQYSAQQKEIKKTEEFIRKNIAGRKAKMARGRQKQLDRMDKMEALEQKEIIPHFHFPVLPLTNTEHLLVKHLAVGYHYPVLSDIDFSIKGGQKVVITGFNGIGKSTLLKTLIGQIPSMQGHFKFSDQVTLGYFEQDLIWDEPEQTPIQIVSNERTASERSTIS